MRSIRSWNHPQLLPPSLTPTSSPSTHLVGSSFKILQRMAASLHLYCFLVSSPTTLSPRLPCWSHRHPAAGHGTCHSLCLQCPFSRYHCGSFPRFLWVLIRYHFLWGTFLDHSPWHFVPRSLPVFSCRAPPSTRRTPWLFTYCLSPIRKCKFFSVLVTVSVTQSKDQAQ